MRKRSTEILQRLLGQADRSLSIQKLADDYGVSEKTLRNDLSEILYFIRDCGMEGQLTCDARSLTLHDSADARKMEEKIRSMSPYDYRLSLEERKFYIVITLLYCDGYCSMQQLADEMYVTRNTIINDCKIVREYLNEFGIDFISRNNRGIRIEGTLRQRENLLINIFCALLPSLACEKDFFVQFLCRKLGFHCGLAQIARYMNAFAREKNIIFAKEVFLEIAICLFVLFNQRQAPGTEARSEAAEDVELDMIGGLVRYAADQCGLPFLDKNEILDIERMILGRDIRPDIHSINDFELYGVISHFLLEIGKETKTDIQNDDLLIKSLISHIKSMKNWSTLEFDIEEEYEEFELFFKVKAAAEDRFCLLENYLRYPLDSNMKDSIVIHICAAMLRSRVSLRPCNVIVSCPGSMATSKYLEAQIRNYFQLNVVRVMSTKQVEMAGEYLDQVDFVISTVRIKNCPVPVVVVSPLLTIEDINQIQAFIFRVQNQGAEPRAVDQSLLSQIQAVYTTGDSKKIAYLNHAIKQALTEVYRMESETANRSPLMKMLKQKYVKLADGPLPWRQAMKEAAADLIRDGYFDLSYVEKAIENVEEYGNYIIVNQGIALAHANKDAGVYEDGISLLIVRDGILFDDGEPVYLLFFFSQKGDTDYLELFREIIRLGNDPDSMEKMRRMNSAVEACQLLVEILTEYEGFPNSTKKVLT